MSASVLNKLRQPDFTQETPRFPNTVRNALIAFIFGFVATSVWLVIVGSFAWIISNIVVTIGIVAVLLQVYLVLVTPELTKQYFPDRILLDYDNDPVPRIRATDPGGDGGTDGNHDGDETPTKKNGGGSSPAKRSEAEAWLSAARVIVPCEQKNDLCLNDDFRTEWYGRIQTIRDNEEIKDMLVQEFDLCPTDIQFEKEQETYIARCDSQKVGYWQSRAAMVAEIAAARELPNWFDEWDNLSTGLRSNLLFTLRIFLNVCPLCDDSVRIATETVEKGGQTNEVFAGTCEGCETRTFEMPTNESD